MLITVNEDLSIHHLKELLNDAKETIRDGSYESVRLNIKSAIEKL